MIKPIMPLAVLIALFAQFVPLPAVAACTDPAEPGVNWRRCYQDSQDLSGADLSNAMLREATFQRSVLRDVNLTGADAFRSKFISADLSNATLTSTRFFEADLTKAILVGADLSEADLRTARLVGANLTDADLTGARLSGADLRRADLSGATWVDGTRICRAGSIGQCN